MSVRTLIDKAAATVGTRYKLAKSLGVTPAQVYNWQEGRATCSPEDRARLAALGGDDALQELVRGVLEKHEGTLRGEQLARVLGKRLHQIGGVAVTGLLGLASLTYGSDASAQLIRCIERLSPRRTNPAPCEGLFLYH